MLVERLVETLREESGLKRLPSPSAPSMKVLLNFLDVSIYRLKRWFLNLGLSPEDRFTADCDVRQKEQDESRCYCRGA
eukprot:5576616-Pleurochrysis_carterae.AAC.1